MPACCNSFQQQPRSTSTANSARTAHPVAETFSISSHLTHTTPRGVDEPLQPCMHSLGTKHHGSQGSNGPFPANASKVFAASVRGQTNTSFTPGTTRRASQHAGCVSWIARCGKPNKQAELLWVEFRLTFAMENVVTASAATAGTRSTSLAWTCQISSVMAMHRRFEA